MCIRIFVPLAQIELQKMLAQQRAAELKVAEEPFPTGCVSTQRESLLLRLSEHAARKVSLVPMRVVGGTGGWFMCHPLFHRMSRSLVPCTCVSTAPLCEPAIVHRGLYMKLCS